MTDLIFNKINETYYLIKCNRSTLMELNDTFSFLIPNHKFHPKVKHGWWDGRIRLVSLQDQTIFVGLKQDLIKFCEERNYTYYFDDENQKPEFTEEDSINFIESLDIPDEFEMRDYQVEAFTHAVNSNRNLILSPTSSGKTYLLYLLVRYFRVRTLIITPLVGLVTQIFGDFQDFGFNSSKFLSNDKNSDKPIITLTWQSIKNIKDQEWYEQFDLVIVDEVHSADAAVLSKIITRLTHAKYRFGLTGTLKDSKSSVMSLTGLFGPIRRTATTRELIDQGYLADIKIKAITLKYNDEDRKKCNKIHDPKTKKSRKATYAEEIDFIIQHQGRMNFLKQLILSLKGNTLVLFRFKEKQGIPLHKLISEDINDRNIHYVSGDIENDIRDEVKELLKSSTNDIIIASDVFTTGISIKTLNNLVFVSPSKARIKTLQSIGRGLRKTKDKSMCTLYDISDDLSIKSYKNFTLGHFIERIKMYSEEEFEYKLYSKELK